jgi:hypothetical protein
MRRLSLDHAGQQEKFFVREKGREEKEKEIKKEFETSNRTTPVRGYTSSNKQN